MNFNDKSVIVYYAIEYIQDAFEEICTYWHIVSLGVLRRVSVELQKVAWIDTVYKCKLINSAIGGLLLSKEQGNTTCKLL